MTPARRITGAMLLAIVLCGAVPAPSPAFTGSAACQTCHEAEHRSWRQSHHYQAMLPATAETVLGDFSDATFEYGGVRSRFFRNDGGYFVETDDESGQLKVFEITHTFGFEPLQQYLVPFPGGRYQALNIVWDSRTAAEGGQRWIHLYPDDPVTHEDPVHWTGTFQTWNSRCAACHSTGLDKGYSPGGERWTTTWAEINVACEACHGPAEQHLEWANGDQPPGDKGFAFSLADRGPFGPGESETSATRIRQDGRRPTTQVETCASCHARRSELAPHRAGEAFSDHFRLALIEPGLYYPDGQVRDEVYVYGSFLQSRMHAGGVVCSNCHEPHSNDLILQGNGLCAQCHDAATFDQAAHHHHPPESEGAACVNCHMPSTTYMVVDDRRDHRFGVPEPGLSLELGVPNACNRCHEDRDAEWASKALQDWGVEPGSRSRHAAALQAAWAGDPNAVPALLNLAQQPSLPFILRASALQAAADFPSREVIAQARQHLQSENDLMRAAAIRAMEPLPLAQRYALLRDYATDPSKSVRLAVARQLAGIPAGQLPEAEGRELSGLFAEYLAAMTLNADMPEEQLNLGHWHAATGDPGAAEKSYRRALELAPNYVPALINLADLYRANGLDDRAEPLLRQAMESAPGQAPPLHALGLLEVRQGRLHQALPLLRRAARAEPSSLRYLYVYAVALWESGDQAAAVSELETALERWPSSNELLSALAAYYQQLGETEKLEAIRKRLPPPS